MIEVNLIPDVKQELIRSQIQRDLIVSGSILASIVAGVVVALAISYVYGAQTLMMNTANSNIDTEYAQLSSVEDLDKMLTIQNQLHEVSQLEKKQYVTSRLYDMLNAVVPESPHDVTISSMTVQPPVEEEEEVVETEEGATATTTEVQEEEEYAIPAEGPVVTIEGQTTGGFASLEVFEKMIASAVIEYTTSEAVGETGEFNCGNEAKQCRWLTIGGGDRATAVNVSEMSFAEDQNGQRKLFFKLSFTTVPELVSNGVSDVTIKIGKDGNVTDSHLGVPRAIFEGRPANEEDQ